MTAEDEFEIALQKYLQAVSLYKLAIKRFVEDMGEGGAQKKLQEAGDRICYQDSRIETPVIMSLQTWQLAAERATPIIDAD